MSNALPFPTRTLRAIRMLAVAVVAICVYLLAQKAAGKIDGLAGCGGEGGCAQVLGGRWSQWFGIPVTALAGAMYLAVFVASLSGFARRRPALAGLLLRGGAVAAAGAALWFFAVLAFVERAFCPYCTAIHLCGLLFAALVFFSAGRSLPGGGGAPAAAGLAGVLVLIAGQWLGPRPDTHQLVDLGGDRPGRTGGTPPASELQFFGGRIRVNPDEVPSAGSREAKHHLLELFDYTCKTCRKTYGHLKALQAAHPDTFRVLYLPCPLDRKCNLFLRSGVRDHPGACELARSALAVWHADRTKFAEIHDYLMRTPLPIPPADAEAKAISLVGEAAYREASRSPAIDGLLAETFGHYGLLAAKDPRMPQLLLDETSLIRGAAADSDTFVSLISRHFRLPETGE